MNSREAHKVWIEQCEAAEGIRERFGVADAARYLVGEKLFRFMQVSQERPEFAKELPKFVADIKRIFTPHEISEFFDDVQAPSLTRRCRVVRRCVGSIVSKNLAMSASIIQLMPSFRHWSRR